MNALPRPGRLVDGNTGLSLVRAINEQRVLEMLLRSGPLSRARTARMTGLSKATVSSLMRDLVACGLVREHGLQSGTVGRPSTLYEVVGRAGYVFAADVGGSKVRAGIADPYGDVLVERDVATAIESGRGLVNQLIGLARELIEEANLNPRHVWAAGIGIPGVYDAASDQVTSAPNLPEDMQDLQVAKSLRDGLGIPVEIENDVNLAAVGERWRGLAQERDHFAAISIGTGIGMGIVLNGELYRGSRGAAGEIDFLPVGSDPFEGHDEHGPFEWASAGPSIVQRLKDQLARGAATSVDLDRGVEGIFEAAKFNDPVAVKVVDQEARNVAMAIAAVAAVLDPEFVVLGGGVGSNPGLLGPVRQYVVQIFPRPIEIAVSALGPAAAFYGAVAVALLAAREELLAQITGVR